MFIYILISLSIIILTVIISVLWLISWSKKPDADYVLKFIAKNPQRSSLIIIKNGKSLANVNANERKPLASTVKIMIAIEFSQQAANGSINPDEKVHLDDLARFYVSHTDGGAHEKWLIEMEKHGFLQDRSVSLMNIAKGMMSHSSNANTEYLMMRIGLENINKNVNKLELPQHEKLFPFVSALFIPYEVELNKGLDITNKQDTKKILAHIQEMSQEAYINEAIKIHQKLSQDVNGEYKECVNIREWYNSEFDKINSKRFTHSTTSEYISILEQMNKGSYFPSHVWAYLQPIIEWPMKFENNQARFKHVGGKGGSTASILTYAFYAEDKEGNKMELAAFFNDIEGYETMKLSNSSSAFQLAMFTEGAKWKKKLQQLH
ncbi:serine hydrolase [Virgibacillus pantothenticus]|uniref:serine hydrolase n=1 Tax=Virgibacillus pantothenticus TaxID=1473 RepID=UPI00067B2801|nr:serine hydrolase [Virgibacillus pantothenticus]MED3736802.1 serine hydrolase [Virgibacillus pantothenticus]QTY15189.1 serine hydrolase [Virgibacillus pantothenticus]SIT05235.1 D-alanyl-D-alanine carboxypeptidase [Virgibacillus pantothenticus]